MLRIVAPAIALAFGAALAQPAAAQSGVDLVKQAVAAQGGAAAVSAPKTTIIKGEAKHWEPGQSYSPTGEARFLGDSTYTQTVDNTARTVRIDWDRDMKYPAVERLKYSEITTPTFGVVIDDKGVQTPMSGIRLAAHLRERERASPRLLARALEDPQSIAALPDQQIGQLSLPAVAIKTRVGTFTVLFDRTTNLPAVVRTRDDDNVYGDSNYDLVVSDWKDVGGGAKRAHTLSFQLNGVEVQRLILKQVTLDAPYRPIPSPSERNSRPRPKRPPAKCHISGCCGAYSSAASSTATRSTTRRTAASSWSSWRRMFSTWSAAPPTT